MRTHFRQIILFFSLPIFFAGCGNKFAESLPGEWMVQNIESAEFNDTDRENVAYAKFKSGFEFQEAGTFYLKFKGVKQDSGKWEIKGKRLQLSGSGSGREYPEYKIEALEKDKLVVISTDEKNREVSTTFVPR